MEGFSNFPQFFARKNKQAAAHIEMISAFMLFFFFVFFLLTILKPYDTTTLSGSVIAAMNDKFDENAMTNLSKAFVKANLTGVDLSSGCFYIILPGGAFAYGFTDSLAFEIRSQDERESNLQNTGSNANLEISESVSEVKFYQVFISPEFPDDSYAGGCAYLDNYVLGSIVEKTAVSKSVLEEMEDDYFNDYDSLKEELGVPSAFDYAIVVYDLPDEFTLQGNSIGGDEILAREYVKEVLYDNGTVYNARFVLKIW